MNSKDEGFKTTDGRPVGVHKPRCATCYYHDAVEVGEGKTVHICRGECPKIFILPVATLQGQKLEANTIWPQVNPEIDFCAKHSSGGWAAH